MGQERTSGKAHSSSLLSRASDARASDARDRLRATKACTSFCQPLTNVSGGSEYGRKDQPSLAPASWVVAFVKAKPSSIVVSPNPVEGRARGYPRSLKVSSMSSCTSDMRHLSTVRFVGAFPQLVEAFHQVCRPPMWFFCGWRAAAEREAGEPKKPGNHQISTGRASWRPWEVQLCQAHVES